MDLNEMKSHWDKVSSDQYSDEQLKQMTQIKKDPLLQRIRIKLIIESVAISIFLLSFYSALDASKKPEWSVILLLISGLMYIVADIANLTVLSHKFNGNSVAEALLRLKSRLSLLSFYSISTSVLFGVSLLIFFSIDIEFTNQKYLILGGILLTFLLSTIFSIKTWNSRIRKIKMHIHELIS